MVFKVGKITPIKTDSLNNLGQSTVDLAKFTEDEFAQVASALQGNDPFTVFFAAPTRPRRGVLAYADGTHWNPGSGEGFYAFGSDAAWHYMENVPAAPYVPPNGTVVGGSITKFATNSSNAGHIPIDDTIPQSSEGTQIITTSYTPLYAGSTLICTFRGQVGLDAGDNFVVGLFNGAANAFAAEMYTLVTAGGRYPILTTGSYAPGAATAQTISVRCGSGIANWAWNGNLGGRTLGGAAAATLVVQELKG